MEPILSNAYWKKRMERAMKRKLPHETFFLGCGPEAWARIEQRHREVLAEKVKPRDAVFDAGCGWGRLLTLLSDRWKLSASPYLGVDLSPDLILEARKRNPAYWFEVGDLRDLSRFYPEQFYPDRKEPYYAVAILVSVRPMMINNLGQSTWDLMEKEIRKVANKILYLEYREDDQGSVE